MARRRFAPASHATIASRPRYRWLAALAVAGCLAMVPWTVRLATTLPERYVIPHWSLTWVGFDLLLLLSFGVTGWTTLRGGRAVWVATAVTATLLGCDAWFDVTTASTTRDLVVSAVTAAAGELPLAALLVYLARRPARGRKSGVRAPCRALRACPGPAPRCAVNRSRRASRGPRR